MTRFQFIGQVAARFRNNLDTAFDKLLPLPVGLENFERHIAKHATNAVNGFDNVGKTQVERTRGH